VVNPLFNERVFDLSDEDLQTLLSFGITEQLSKGDQLYGEGETVRSLWFIRSGRVHLTKLASSGTESLVAFYGPGQSFCVAATLLDQPFPCAARAATDVELVRIPADRFLALFDSLPGFAKRLLREMAPQFCGAHCDCALNVERLDKRLATTLLRLDGHFAGQAIPFTRLELAQMVNTTVESCIRKLSAWTKAGWLDGARGEVQVLDRPALEAILLSD
jgi:CRP/FNR family transcriptional regulator